VVTSTVAFEPSGPKEYVGGYDDWLRQRPAPTAAVVAAKAPASQPASRPAASEGRKKGLSYKEKQELGGLPAKIEQFESEVAALHERMAQPDFYRQPGPEIAKEQARLAEIETNLAAAYQRWEELEERAE
jgi:ATP-binding cassette subfamily F protein uup